MIDRNRKAAEHFERTPIAPECIRVLVQLGERRHWTEQLPATGYLHQPERLARSSPYHPRAARGCAAGPDLRRMIQLIVVIHLSAAQLDPKADGVDGPHPASVCHTGVIDDPQQGSHP